MPGLVCAQDTWMSVTLQGRKVGSMHLQRHVDGNHVITRQTLALTLQRAGTDLQVRSEERDVETSQGQVLGFSSRTQMSGQVSAVRGTRDTDGRFTITRSLVGRNSTRSIDWPAGALLAEGQRLAAQRAGQAPGTRWQTLIYDVGSGQVLRADNQVVGRETVALPAAKRTLTHITQTLHVPSGGSETQQLWFDEHGNVLKSSMAALGQPLLMLACDRACAQAPNQSVDLFAHTLTPLPRTLSASERGGELRYVFSAKDRRALHFAQTDEQQVRHADDGRWIIDIGGAATRRQPAPDADDTAANAWMQSDDPAIVALARRAVGTSTGNAARMQRLQAFVSHYISHKNLSVGYASALEVLHSREGDCTEHAVLLGALARALGIPARVVVGLVYMPHFADARAALVPHAWVQAWVGDHWRSYDAALDGFDSGHIALAVGNGDPWQFFLGTRTLGDLQVDSVSSKRARNAKTDAPAAR